MFRRLGFGEHIAETNAFQFGRDGDVGGIRSRWGGGHLNH
ncbi:hypothetical protein SF83666_b49510 (plasmid) [Sinorhizobium fredii CCBAU 83666]|nr:hypothetical protein SF83666_b49510 [Sinorhizobium fredii CCBAU 83666]